MLSPFPLLCWNQPPVPYASLTEAAEAGRHFTCKTSVSLSWASRQSDMGVGGGVWGVYTPPRAGLRVRGPGTYFGGGPLSRHEVSPASARSARAISAGGPGARLSALGPARGENFWDIARFYVKNWLKNWVLVSFGHFLVVWDCFGPRGGGPLPMVGGPPGGPFFQPMGRGAWH